MNAIAIAACPGCGARFASITGPVHDYMESSPACWKAFGEVLARSYQNPHWGGQRLCVDAYAVQHPGGDSRQAIQSVGVHLSRLCLFLERGLSAERANAAMLQIGTRKAAMVKLSRPADLGAITVADVLDAHTESAHAAAVRAWAASAWQAWAAHHSQVRRWVDEAGV
jgi:hypothetical protein